MIRLSWQQPWREREHAADVEDTAALGEAAWAAGVEAAEAKRSLKARTRSRTDRSAADAEEAPPGGVAHLVVARVQTPMAAQSSQTAHMRTARTCTLTARRTARLARSATAQMQRRALRPPCCTM